MAIWKEHLSIEETERRLLVQRKLTAQCLEGQSGKGSQAVDLYKEIR